MPTERKFVVPLNPLAKVPERPGLSRDESGSLRRMAVLRPKAREFAPTLASTGGESDYGGGRGKDTAQATTAKSVLALTRAIVGPDGKEPAAAPAGLQSYRAISAPRLLTSAGSSSALLPATGDPERKARKVASRGKMAKVGDDAEGGAGAATSASDRLLVRRPREGGEGGAKPKRKKSKAAIQVVVPVDPTASPVTAAPSDVRVDTDGDSFSIQKNKTPAAGVGFADADAPAVA